MFHRPHHGSINRSHFNEGDVSRDGQKCAIPGGSCCSADIWYPGERKPTAASIDLPSAGRVRLTVEELRKVGIETRFVEVCLGMMKKPAWALPDHLHMPTDWLEMADTMSVWHRSSTARSESPYWTSFHYFYGSFRSFINYGICFI
jgi:hypothetical protein